MAFLNAVERSVHLHGPSRLPVVNYYYYNDLCQGKSGLSYHSASSPVSYQPQRIRLLSEVNEISPCRDLFPDNDRRSIHYPLHSRFFPSSY